MPVLTQLASIVAGMTMRTLSAIGRYQKVPALSTPILHR
jgi:hypothetical protein